MKENKLQLRRETLRQLSSEDLEQANGGTSFSIVTAANTGALAGGLVAVGNALKWGVNHVGNPKLSGRYSGAGPDR